jgi:hypothetical protein
LVKLIAGDLRFERTVRVPSLLCIVILKICEWKEISVDGVSSVIVRKIYRRGKMQTRLYNSIKQCHRLYHFHMRGKQLRSSVISGTIEIICDVS